MKDSRYRFGWWRVAMLIPVALVAFAPASQAQIEVAVAGDAVPGGTVTATVTITDGSTPQSFAWTQEEGVTAVLTGDDTATVTVDLGALSAYKNMLFHVLAEPPIDEDELPPNVPLPEGEFPAGLQDRFEVVGLNPFALEEAALVTLEVEVVTSSGTYHGEAEIHAMLPWKPALGIRNVPIGIPVLLHGKDQASYDWTLTAPGGSGATLMDATTQNPEFVPDVAGRYDVMVTEETDGEKALVTLQIYAGTWRGTIVGQDGEGRPVADAACTGCHSFTLDQFTPWAQTGHAEIFSDSLDTNTHYGENCFSCHTVGFDLEVANGGFDDAPGYDDFLEAGLLNVPGDNWTTVLADYPAMAQLANIQCENCHGPQLGNAHTQGDPRTSLSSDSCATCHGEPLRHGRFQQWQLSGHANYELAIDESQSGSCARCHTGNGFLTWLPILLDDNPATDPTADVTVDWTADETHPITCQTCHDPHSIGTVSGDDSNATVRISGDTPPLIAGFTVTDAGRGAICMTCHNSRRGLRNDATFATFYGTSEAARAPHGSSQTDVLLGQNAYFVAVGAPGGHAGVEDTCVTCHMQETPPPDVLSYDQGGTNHTFFAGENSCDTCHPGLTGAIIQAPIEASLMELRGMIEDALLELIGDQIAAGNTIDLGGQATITNASDVADIEFGESHGRQAMTVTFMDTTMVGPLRMQDVDVVPPAPAAAFDIYDVSPPSLIKAGWNWNLVNSDGSLGVHNPSFVTEVLDDAIAGLMSDEEPCIADGDTMCLNKDRFQVEVAWRDFQDNTGSGQVAPAGSDDSGIFYFFDPNNWEMLIKVLDGCAITNNYWVFFAATTNVEFTLRVTDTQENVTKVYTNPLGQAANAVTDTSAFATCP